MKSNAPSLILLGLAISCALVAGCWQKAAIPPPVPPTPSPFPELKISTHNFPRMDGSTSTLPLARVLACKILDAPYEWVFSESDDSRYVVASDMYESLTKEDYRGEKAALCEYINELVEHHGTHEAYVNLIEKRADLILVARQLSADELDLAADRDVKLEAQPVALDAFVFLVNRRNSVTGLSLEQIRGIYSGKIANWRSVGGPDQKITPYQRGRNSGSQELMLSLVMKGERMVEASPLVTGTLMSSPFLAIDDDESGIGYSVYYYQEQMAPRTSVRACAIDGIQPSAENLRNRKYPLVTEVFVVVRTDLPADHEALRLRDWLIGAAGQKVVEEGGYVPLSGDNPMVESNIPRE